MSGLEAGALQPAPPIASDLPTTTVADEWSKRTGLPKHLFSRSKEFEETQGDMSKLDKHGRPTHTKGGDLILRFR
jgi:hypothetical protein